MVNLWTGALTTLETAKLFIGIPEDDADRDRDKIVTLMINSVSAWFERQTGRKLGLAAYDEKYAGTDAQELCLRQYPIVKVESIFDTENGGEISPDAYGFVDTGDIGVLFKDDGWAMPSYRVGLAFDPKFPKRYLRVKYKAGYVLPKDATRRQPSTLPPDIEGMILEMLQQQYNLMKDGAQNLSSFSISDVSWSFDKTTKQSWLETLAAHKRWW